MGSRRHALPAGRTPTEAAAFPCVALTAYYALVELARAQPGTDGTAAFPTLAAASAFALDVANAPAIVKRAISVFEAPMAHRFLEADHPG